MCVCVCIDAWIFRGLWAQQLGSHTGVTQGFLAHLFSAGACPDLNPREGLGPPSSSPVITQSFVGYPRMDRSLHFEDILGGGGGRARVASSRIELTG